MILLGVIPSLNQTISHGESSSLVGTKIVEAESCSSKSVLDVVDNGSLDASLVGSDVGVHHGPEFLLSSLASLAKLWSEEFLLRASDFLLLEHDARVPSLEARALGGCWIHLLLLLFDHGGCSGLHDSLSGLVDLAVLSLDLLLLGSIGSSLCDVRGSLLLSVLLCHSINTNKSQLNF